MKIESKAYYEFKVDVKAPLPVYEQVKRAIKLGILSGRLEEGQKLLTLRKLAEKLNINPNTIIKIYFQLEKEGFVYSRPGSGYYVQLDREKMKKGTEEFFADETRDYVDKFISMGFSYNDIIEEIKKSFELEK